MNEIISYLYNINISNELKYDGQVLYKTNSSHYLYKEIDNNYSAILFLYNIIKQIKNYHFFSYNFKQNIFNDIISTYNEKKFVLIDVGNDYDKIVDFDDMFSFYNDSRNILICKVKYRNNWDLLWESKISYLSEHFNTNKLINKNYSLIFNYYISIAEIALEYLLKVKRRYSDNNQICFAHRRILYPNIKLNFYNPLNFIIDIEQRDISEYIKSLFYNHEDYENELVYYLKLHKMDHYSASLLYARIIYPSIFLDDYETNALKIEKYIDFDLYEKFIKKIYDIISSYILIDKIDWLD